MFSFWSISGPHLGHIFQSASPASASRTHVPWGSTNKPTSLPSPRKTSKSTAGAEEYLVPWYCGYWKNLKISCWCWVISSTCVSWLLRKTSKSTADAEKYFVLLLSDYGEKPQNLLLVLKNIWYSNLVATEKKPQIPPLVLSYCYIFVVFRLG